MAKARVYYKTNKLKVKAQRKIYSALNKSKIKAQTKAYYIANKARLDMLAGEWRNAHPEEVRNARHRRRALKAKVLSELIDVKKVFTRDGWICQHCKNKVSKKLKWPDIMSASLDHIVPLSKGGSHIYANVQLAHLTCNLSKRAGVAPQGEQLRIF